MTDSASTPGKGFLLLVASPDDVPADLDAVGNTLAEAKPGFETADFAPVVWPATLVVVGLVAVRRMSSFDRLGEGGVR